MKFTNHLILLNKFLYMNIRSVLRMLKAVQTIKSIVWKLMKTPHKANANRKSIGPPRFVYVWRL